SPPTSWTRSSPPRIGSPRPCEACSGRAGLPGHAQASERSAQKAESGPDGDPDQDQDRVEEERAGAYKRARDRGGGHIGRDAPTLQCNEVARDSEREVAHQQPVV